MTTTTLDRNAWELQGACRDNPDLWFAVANNDRALARHICLRHCPVFEQCRAAAGTNPCPFGVQAGVLYNDSVTDPQPANKQPQPTGRHCPTCIGGRPTVDKWADCGTDAAYRRHTKLGQDPCPPCAEAARQREASKRRARRKAAIVGRCGTPNGIHRHYRLGEKPCETCMTAAQAAGRASAATVHARYVAKQAPTIARIGELAALGLTNKQISGRLGVADYTVRRLRKRYLTDAGEPVAA